MGVRPGSVGSSIAASAGTMPAASSVPAGTHCFRTDQGLDYVSDGTNWNVIKPGQELGYVEKADADFTTSANNTYVDITGLTLTLTLDGLRPIRVMAGGTYLKQSSATASSEVALLQGASIIQKADYTPMVANGGCPWSLSKRLSLAAGTYTFKLQAAQLFGAGTTTVSCSSTSPSWLQVVTV